MSTPTSVNDPQWPYVDPKILEIRRQRVYLVLSGLFLGTLAMLNILGISMFIKLFSYQLPFYDKEVLFAVAVGVLPYPITFLCTDLISEFYGPRRSNDVVWMGVFLNLWIVLILWLGEAVTPADARLPINAATGLPIPTVVEVDQATGRTFPTLFGDGYAFFAIKHLAFGAVVASMIAFAAAQFCDVYLFHFWKRLTKGKHLWLRNNGSTMISQLVDAVSVILITHFFTIKLVTDENPWPGLIALIVANYTFKFICALLDTGPFYLLVWWLKDYLQIDPTAEHES